jgi:hypothetical protein
MPEQSLAGFRWITSVGAASVRAAIVSQIKIRAFEAVLTLGKGLKTPKHYLNIYSSALIRLKSTHSSDPGA